jgi:ElaB/YqjD/DUF883 family membrane-anchored ribosome-binding protein
MAERTYDSQDVAARRATLDEKLESTKTRLGDQPGSERIRRDIEKTRASLDSKLDALESKVRGVQSKAKQAFDFNYQVSQHPWGMFGASFATGFILGLLGDGAPRKPAARHLSDRGRSRRRQREESEAQYSASAESARYEPRQNDILETLKLAAGAAVTDLARQALHKYVPALGEHLDKIWQERGLTPTSAASAFLSQRRERAQAQAARAAADKSHLTEDFAAGVEPAEAPEMRGEMASRS